MLQIRKISKQYKTSSLTQQALNEVSLNLRDNEFVAILGPSGSGKTTLLNIIGGLDRYDSGDLIINGISTKNYKDRDWDSYRNHTIGFVFQSYNLIPHQTILANVELALTISGVSKKQRRQKAKDALIQVGLKDHMKKRPNQLSGGQMQRVAIARALVNDPDILLADEPTGALDSTTSVQVMDLLKEVAKERLVVMVTHNPELAEEYATRIVRLKDGEIISDSDPFDVSECEAVHKNLGKSSMSFLTAFGLSANNLLTKKGRTILTAFAGSIGIIGIALILSLSTGFQNYIDKIQEDTLTSYPLTLTSETGDATSLLMSMVQPDDRDEDGIVYEQQVISSMFSSVGSNDLKSFKGHLEQNAETVDELVSLIQYKYGVSPQIYTKHEEFGIVQVNPSTLMSSISGADTSMMSAMSSLSSVSSSNVFYEMLDDLDSLKDQYDVLAGKWPEQYNEMVLVLSDSSSISDMLVYSLGLRDSDELKDMMTKLMAKEEVVNKNEPMQFTYEELLNLEYKLIDASSVYRYSEKYDIYESMVSDEEYMENIYAQSEPLKIVGVVCAKEGSSGSLTTGVGYLKELTSYVIDKAAESEIVLKQMANRQVDVFSGKRFDDDSEESGLQFDELISIDTKMLESAFGTNVSEEQMTQMMQSYMTEIAEAIDADTVEIETVLNEKIELLSTGFLQHLMEVHGTDIESEFTEALDPQQIVENLLVWLNQNYPSIQVDQKSVDELLSALESLNASSVKMLEIKKSEVSAYVSEYMASESVQSEMALLTEKYTLPKEAFDMMYSGMISGMFEMLFEILPSDQEDPSIFLTDTLLQPLSALYSGVLQLSDATHSIAVMIQETRMQMSIMTKVGELTGELISTMASAFNVDPAKIAGAFTFDLSEEELTRLISTMTSSGVEKNADTNLLSLGYQDKDAPTSISFYFKDFESKEAFMDFLDDYNDQMELQDEDKVIKYTDLTGLLMSSVKTIVDSVSYVLIAFVSISLVVSSIMIGIITYISVLERTKEIGVLRAIGASKKNISSIFNAETFIIGLISGLLGISVTLSLIPVINAIIHNVTGNMDINAVLPYDAAGILVLLSVILTLIGGLIPSSQAAKKDPVTALRTE